MKMPVTIVLAIVISGNIFGQKELVYTPAEKEYSFKLFPYSDGSFSLYSASYEKLDPSSIGTLRTYDEKGDLVLEKVFPDVMQFANQKSKEGFDMLLLFHQFSNPLTKETFTIGYSGKLDFHCRIMNEKGDVKDIVVAKSELKSDGNLIVQGYGIDAENNVNVLLSTSKLKGKNQVVLLHFNIRQNLFKVIELNNQDPDNFFSYLRFIGSRNSQLIFLCEDREIDSRVELLEINSEGEVKKQELQLPSEIGNISNYFAEHISVIGGSGNEFVFYLRKIRTSDFTICKITQDNQAKWTSWAVPKDLFDKEAAIYHLLEEQSAFLDHFPSLSIYDFNNQYSIAYSYKGKDLSILPFDWEMFHVGPFDLERYYDKINPGSITDFNTTNRVISNSPLDFVPFIQQSASFHNVNERLSKCNEKNSQCLLNVATIYNLDGTFGFLMISGDKVEGKRYYQNVKITKY